MQVEEENGSDEEVEASTADIEDIGSHRTTFKKPIVINTKRKRAASPDAVDLSKSWREILGPPPPMGETEVMVASTIQVSSSLLVFHWCYLFL